MSTGTRTEPKMLPDISTAKLPAVYEAAMQAMAKCSRIDQCQEWANKAEALASYAKQSKDKSLHKLADRIQARAVRRCGELLNQLPEQRGANQNIRDGAVPKVTRVSAAADAGLSERQRKTALRVASVPEDDFERQVEGDNPPTVTSLADQGRKPLLELGQAEPKNIANVTQALAQLRRFAIFAADNDPRNLASVVIESDRPAARENVAKIQLWLHCFFSSIPCTRDQYRKARDGG